MFLAPYGWRESRPSKTSPSKTPEAFGDWRSAHQVKNRGLGIVCKEVVHEPERRKWRVGQQLDGAVEGGEEEMLKEHRREGQEYQLRVSPREAKSGESCQEVGLFTGLSAGQV